MSESNLYATFETTMGDIRVQLYENESPKTVENFVGLATGSKAWTHPGTGESKQNTPFYDGILFHRIIPNFMVQTGCPLGRGIGGPGYNIPDEFDDRLSFDGPGVVGMANAGPGTGGSQFFITHCPTTWLDGKHTIFGRVVEGQNIVDAMATVARDSNDKPLEDIIINKITIEKTA